MAQPLVLEQIFEEKRNPHFFKVWNLVGTEAERRVADEYKTLRTASASPLSAVVLEGIELLSTDGLRQRIEAASLPTKRGGNLDVWRADFGEVLCYMVLEREFTTIIGHKSIQHRELANQPARGIDAIGIENLADGRLRLVFAEAKVSGEGRSPPRVVEGAPDCLKSQLLGHVEGREKTSRKLWDNVRKTVDPAVSEMLAAAALYFDNSDDKRLEIVCCGFLIRARDRYQESDFGCFRTTPEAFQPAGVRFLIVCVAGDIDSVVSRWHDMVIEGLDE